MLCILFTFSRWLSNHRAPRALGAAPVLEQSLEAVEKISEDHRPWFNRSIDTSPLKAISQCWRPCMGRELRLEEQKQPTTCAYMRMYKHTHTYIYIYTYIHIYIYMYMYTCDRIISIVMSCGFPRPFRMYAT